MKFDPATGEEKPYPSNAEQYRTYHGKVAWLFNPWTGDNRSAQDIGSDIFGHLIEDGSIEGYGYLPSPKIDTTDIIQYLKSKTGWTDDWVKHGFNGCFYTAIDALNYLARYDRPNGGEDKYNGMHLVQIAQELQLTRKKLFEDGK